MYVDIMLIKALIADATKIYPSQQKTTYHIDIMGSFTRIAVKCILVLAVQVYCAYGEDGIQQSLMKCPGLYCGRTIDAYGNHSECGACHRGYRPNESSICMKCEETPSFYDWLYLGFMTILAPALHWFFIDFTNKRKNGGLLILHACALIESCIAAIGTLLVSEPIGTLNVISCKVHRLSDWYTMLYNPSPDYTSMLHCAQEAVYPLYTIVMIYYAFGLVCMVLLRPILSAKCVNYRGTKSLYAALYFFPILIVLQAVFAGLLYYAFPYIVLVVSIITNAAHLAFFKEQNFKYLLKENFTNLRNLTIVLCHWLLHAYGIIAITQIQDPAFHGPLLCLIPAPFLFYLVTVKFTDPSELETVSSSRHRD